MKEKEFLQEVKETNLLQQASGTLDQDTQIGIPEKASAYRSEVGSCLCSIYFSKKTDPRTKEAIRYFPEHPEELSEVGAAVFTRVKEEYDLEHRTPGDLMRKCTATVSLAHGQQQKVGEIQQFSDFQHASNQNIGLTKQLIPYWGKDEKINYDVLLNQYEPGMTVEILGKVFDQLKEGILSIRCTLREKRTEPRTGFLSRRMTKKQQKRSVMEVVEQLGYDFSRGRLDDTVYPFMTGINSDDTRVTTRWSEIDFKMAAFGVTHEASHGMYEQSIDDKYAYTPAYEGTSMGIHKSQSLFNEVITGNSHSFWKKQYPFFRECAEGTFDDVPSDKFYRSLNHTKSSLIRIEAGSLTYPLHIIVRYEIEKMIFNEGVDIAELSKTWSQKYGEYLGIRPTDGVEGILQDVHQSGASSGYFPSYALGYIYATQLLRSLQQEIGVENVLAPDDYSPIKNWMSEHIHRCGISRKPDRLTTDATYEPFNPQYLIGYIRDLYFNVYQVK